MPKGVYVRKPRRPVDERFWSKVDKNGPTLRPELGQCWMWTASIGSHGYGQIQTGGGPTTAHRFSWELANGPIPAGEGPHGTYEASVATIRRLHADGGLSQCEIARRFGVSKYVVNAVVLRRTWKHVA